MFVAFSCRQRCLCPSRHQKRTPLAAETIAHTICQAVPHRQLVFTIPKQFGKRFGGRLTFYVPVDIQRTMCKETPDQVRANARKMVRTLGRPEGDIIVRYYGNPVVAGHSKDNLDAMCQEFLKINDEMASGIWKWA